MNRLDFSDAKRRAVLIFLRNPEIGRVKTRLAADTGEVIALDVYKRLVSHTLDVCTNIPCERYLFFDTFIPAEYSEAHGRLQSGSDLGERMFNAFEQVFASGIDYAVILGSDCAEITAKHLHQAFTALEKTDAVIGPAADGGYYLLGLKQAEPKLFTQKRWSTSSVYADTVKDFFHKGWTFSALETLRDVDTLDDLRNMPHLWEKLGVNHLF
jgi:uncharacterized protein